MELELKNFSYVRIDFFKNHECIKCYKARNMKDELKTLKRNFIKATQVKDYDYYEIFVL